MDHKLQRGLQGHEEIKIKGRITETNINGRRWYVEVLDIWT